MKIIFETNMKHYNVSSEQFEKYVKDLQEALSFCLSDVEETIYEGDNRCLSDSIVFTIESEIDENKDVAEQEMIKDSKIKFLKSFEQSFFDNYEFGEDNE